MNVYRLQGIEFEWNENKARSNVHKHHVTFEEAAEVFFDPFYQTGDAFVNDEQRDFVLGYSAKCTLTTGSVYRARRAHTHHFGSRGDAARTEII